MWNAFNWCQLMNKHLMHMNNNSNTVLAVVLVNYYGFNIYDFMNKLIELIKGSDSPDADIRDIQQPVNGTTVYVSSHQTNEDGSVGLGLRYSSASVGGSIGGSSSGPGTAEHVRYEDESYPPRYEYHQQHHPATSNAHTNPDEIKIELIRNQHPLHGKVIATINLKNFCLFDFSFLIFFFCI